MPCRRRRRRYAVAAAPAAGAAPPDARPERRTEACEAAAHASHWEAVMQPGELIFVPAGCPHQVVNLEPTVAVAMNFVDAGNVELAAAEMEEKAAGSVGSAHDYYAALAGHFADTAR